MSEDSRLAAGLAGTNRWLTLLGFFGAGLLLAFTPCVLPMIPILSGLIAGQGTRLGTGRALVLSLVYVVANALVFTVAGVVAGLLGANLQAAFQNPWIITAFAALFVALALSSFGLYELQLPMAVRSRLGALTDRQRGGSLAGVAAMGALSALIVGPCVAPPLAGAVLYIGQSHDPVLGGAALFLLAMGMGAPLLAFGAAAGRGMPTSGPWMTTAQRVFGFVFLGLAVWMLSRILPATGDAGPVGRCWRWPRRRGRSAPAPASSRSRMFARFAGLVLAVVGAAQLLGALGGGSDPLQPLAGLTGARADAHVLAFRTIKSNRRPRSRTCGRAGGRQAAAARFLCRLVRELQGDGEVHLHRSRGAGGACRLRAAQGRCHRQRRDRPGPDAALRHHRSAGHAVLRRRAREQRGLRLVGLREGAGVRRPQRPRAMRPNLGDRPGRRWRLAGLGLLAGLMASGSPLLLRTEFGQRALGWWMATTSSTPEGVAIARRGESLPAMALAVAGRRSRRSPG